MQGMLLPGNFNGSYHLTPKSVVSLNIPELNYIAIMFEFNAESIGQVNCYVPTHNESCFLRTKTSQNTGGAPPRRRKCIR